MGDDYFRASNLDAWLDEHPRAGSACLGPFRRRLVPEPARSEHDRAAVLLRDPREWVDQRNAEFVQEKVRALANWFENRLEHPLTAAQRRAVVIDEDTNLVIAGAGAGKTSTLITKLAYLLEVRDEDPSSILVLAFNTSVAAELADRVEAMGLPAPEISTFHAKGFDVMGEALRRKPAVSSLATDQKALWSLLQDEFEAILTDRKRRRVFTRWWVRFRVVLEDLEDASTPDDRLRLEEALGLRTLTGVKVASMSEVKVADWLTLNGVAWEHEKRYPHTPEIVTHREYTPDFFLPAHNAWLEVWACDRTGTDFPAQIDREQYLEGMAWKRKLHEANETRLIEVFQDDIWGEGLDDTLVRQLVGEHGGADELSEGVSPTLLETVRSNVAPFVMLIGTFLRLFRSGGWTPDEVEAKATNQREQAFLQLFWPFLRRYEQALEDEGKIDFDAMLVEAANLASTNKSPSKQYRYILVDEFQDTSRARIKLVQALRRARSGCRVFAVGDDWQAIYRFAGSDISYFNGVEEYLGPTARTVLPDTFRLESDVADLSTRFVLQNTAQFPKRLVPRAKSGERSGVQVVLHPPHDEMSVVQRILDRLSRTNPAARVLVLARYNFRLREVREAPVPAGLEVVATTVHRAKGLEADAVIVLGVEAGLYGFPTEIQDDRVLRLLLEREEHFPNAEERRLFYVALTRTRSKVFLLANWLNASRFINELGNETYAPWISFEGKAARGHLCPLCGGHTIMRREGAFGEFWGCAHYPACSGTLPSCPRCGRGALVRPPKGSSHDTATCDTCGHRTPVCPGCRKGVLIEREGPYGRFLGCTEWRGDGSGCDVTQNPPRRVEG